MRLICRHAALPERTLVGRSRLPFRSLGSQRTFFGIPEPPLSLYITAKIKCVWCNAIVSMLASYPTQVGCEREKKGALAGAERVGGGRHARRRDAPGTWPTSPLCLSNKRIVNRSGLFSLYYSTLSELQTSERHLDLLNSEIKSPNTSHPPLHFVRPRRIGGIPIPDQQ